MYSLGKLGEMCSDPNSGQRWLCLGAAPSYYSIGEAESGAVKMQLGKADEALKNAGKMAPSQKGDGFEIAAALFKNIEALGMTQVYYGNQPPASPIEDYNNLTVRMKAIIAQELSEIDFQDPEDIKDVKEDLLEDWKVSEKLTQEIISGKVDSSNKFIYYAVGGSAVALAILGYHWMK